jgi:Protein of unknown function (DUF4038)/Domain of unknown function (DUF5060)/Putative collagen-binding domain of a collagenase
MSGPQTLPIRTVGEWSFHSDRAYYSPFADVQVDGVFTAPGGTRITMPAFYDGSGIWRLRFNPGQVGDWRLQLTSRPHNPDLAVEATFKATANTARGTLRATPDKAWGYSFEDGTPFLPIGDTVYDLFGMEYCGGDIPGFLARRKEQGFNLFRTRLSISAFHPPEGDFEWQTRRMWPWGGSPTSPRFDLFNLDWFQAVDGSVQRIEALGLGLEMIMEGWGFEFPFNHRAWFTPEWEQLWMRYVIARYDAYNCVYFWTPLNEYEYYPNGDWNWKPAADRWLIRVSRWIKDTAPHGHLTVAHNGPVVPPFAERFRADPEAIDSINFQFWGTRDRENAWLAIGIEDVIANAMTGWHGSRLFAEWGYERNPAFANKLPHHEFCDRNHTRRSAWRGVTQAMGIINGQENSWGPWMLLHEDLPGTADIVTLRDFLTHTVPFHTLRPAPDLVHGDFAPGHRPLALQSVAKDMAVVYFPAGDGAGVAFAASKAEWFDPRDGSSQTTSANGTRYTAPAKIDEDGHPMDYVLVLRK